MQITNNHEISLPMAVWLLHDEYDYIREENYISATSLLRSTKQIILSKRVPSENREADVTDFLAARFGHAVHDSIEKAWRSAALPSIMKRLGYPDAVADNLVVNPTEDYLKDNPNTIPVWIERRSIKEVTLPDGTKWKVGGKFDMVLDGRLFDFKTTSVYAYIKGSKDEDYAAQGGIYRWLNPDLIESDHIFIQFMFTDWQRAEANRNPNYPQQKAKEYPVLLPSIEDSQDFVVAKLQELSRLWDAPEDKLPDCTDKELWRSDPQFKYYSDPEKAKDPSARSTKNFDSLAEAEAFKREKGKGVVITKLGEVKACAYCAAFPVCKQRLQYDFEDV